MKRNKTIESLQGRLLENRKKQNEIYRRKKKIAIFSFFSFLFVLGISFFLYKYSTAKVEFAQDINLKYVDNIIYLSDANFSEELNKVEKIKKTNENYSQANLKFVKKYVVQLAVFKNLDNADRLKKKLEKKGYDIYYEKYESYYRVRLENTFNSRIIAEEYAKNLKETNIIDNYWVRLK